MMGAMREDALVCDCDVIHDETVERVRGLMPGAEDFFGVTALYKVFSDATRAKILWALSCEEMCVCDIAALLGLTKSAVSHQLKLLRVAGLVRYRRQGQIVFYSQADECARDILGRGLEHVKHFLKK